MANGDLRSGAERFFGTLLTGLGDVARSAPKVVRQSRLDEQNRRSQDLSNLLSVAQFQQRVQEFRDKQKRLQDSAIAEKAQEDAKVNVLLSELGGLAKRGAAIDVNGAIAGLGSSPLANPEMARTAGPGVLENIVARKSRRVSNLEKGLATTRSKSKGAVQNGVEEEVALTRVMSAVQAGKSPSPKDLIRLDFSPSDLTRMILSSGPAKSRLSSSDLVSIERLAKSYRDADITKLENEKKQIESKRDSFIKTKKGEEFRHTAEDAARLREINKALKNLSGVRGSEPYRREILQAIDAAGMSSDELREIVEGK